MKNIFYILMCVLFLFSSCNKNSDTPEISKAVFSKQVTVMDGVINKILSEEDPIKMHKMADAIESARAVSCIPVGDECNAYYKVINKAVNVTKEGKLSDDDKVLLFKLYNEFRMSVRESEKKFPSEKVEKN